MKARKALKAKNERVYYIMVRIAPSILASDFSRLGDEIARVEEGGADLIHIDVMDGHFVPNITIGPPVIKSIRKTTKLLFDVHLMVDEPDRYIDEFIHAGADILTVHAECCHHLNRVVQRIREMGCKPCVALNPATSLTMLDYILEDVDMILLMTVNPGFGGQSYIESVTGKISNLAEMMKKRGIKKDIEVDGGISVNNIYAVTKAGANVIVAGTAVFGSPDAALAISKLKEKAFDVI